MKKIIAILMLLLASSCASFYKNGEYRHSEELISPKLEKSITIFFTHENIDRPKYNKNDIKAWNKAISSALDSYDNIIYSFTEDANKADLKIIIKSYVDDDHWIDPILCGLTFGVFPMFMTLSSDIKFLTKDKKKLIRTEENTVAMGLSMLPVAPFAPLDFDVKENMIKSGINELIDKNML